MTTYNNPEMAPCKCRPDAAELLRAELSGVALEPCTMHPAPDASPGMTRRDVAGAVAASLTGMALNAPVEDVAARLGMDAA